MIVTFFDRGDRASLGEKGYLLSRAKQAGLPVPDGFVITTETVASFYQPGSLRRLLNLPPVAAADHRLVGQLLNKLSSSVKELDNQDFLSDLRKAYDRLCGSASSKRCSLVVRLSAPREPMREIGQSRTILPVESFDELTKAIGKLLTAYLDRTAVVSKLEHGQLAPHHLAPALIVQQLVEAVCGGVASSIEPVSRSSDVIVVEAALGYGNPVLGGEITPDRYLVAKGTFRMLDQQVSQQRWQLAYNRGGLKHIQVPAERGSEPKLDQGQLTELAHLVMEAEQLLQAPVELEWIKGPEGFWIVDLRTVSSSRRATVRVTAHTEHALKPPRSVAAKGLPASPGVASGPVRLVSRAQDVDHVAQGEVVVAELSSPAFLPAFSKAAAVVTDTGGVNSHAAVAARELGIPCIVATATASHRFKDGQVITVDGTHGLVYAGTLTPELAAGEHHHVSWISQLSRQGSPIIATKLYVNLTDPSLASSVAKLPVDGVGLLRSEFMVASLGEHPQALLSKGKRDVMVDKLSAKLGEVAEAFAPRPVVYRLSDLKTSEYRHLKGGQDYEPVEENPALGFRGARRLLDQPAWLGLELDVIRRCRDEQNLRNIWLMVPFVRTPEELTELRQTIDRSGLAQSHDFRLWMMVEVPSNVILIRDFLAQGIDGVSIGTNDLTSLIMGVDRDAGRLSSLYPATHPAVLKSLVHVVTAARQYAVTSSICGQAAAVYPEVVETLVKAGITSVSVAPDSVQATRELIASVERQLLLERAIW